MIAKRKPSNMPKRKSGLVPYSQKPIRTFSLTKSVASIGESFEKLYKLHELADVKNKSAETIALMEKILVETNHAIKLNRLRIWSENNPLANEVPNFSNKMAIDSGSRLSYREQTIAKVEANYRRLYIARTRIEVEKILKDMQAQMVSALTEQDASVFAIRRRNP